MMNDVQVLTRIWWSVLLLLCIAIRPVSAQEISQIPVEALESYHQGVFYGKAGKYVEAVMELNRAVEAYPEYADAYNALGVVYHRQQELQEAIASYRRTIELDPRHAKARTNLALVYKEQADYEQAVQQVQEALKTTPSYAPAQKLLPEVQTLLKEQQAVQAKAAAEATAGTETRKAPQRKAPVKAITASSAPPSKSASSTKPTPKPTPATKSTFEAGTTIIRKGDIDAGIEAYQGALTQLPCSAEGLTLLGMAYREKFRVTQQLAWQQEEVMSFQKAIQCDPTYIPAVLALAETMYAQKDYVNAVRYFQYVLQYQPDHPAREQIETFLGKN